MDLDMDFFQRREAEQAAHEAECKAAECDRCARFICPVCGKVSHARRRACHDCQDIAGREAWRGPALDSIPLAFGGARFDEEWLPRLVGAQAMQQAKTSLDRMTAVFIGPPGSGKTSLAIAMFRAAVEQAAKPYGKSTSRYMSSHALAKARAGHPLGHGEAPLVEEALDAALLVIDELGAEDARHASAIAEVIYERHANGMHTWITTGSTPEKLADRYGGGIARRVFESAAIFRLVGRRS